MKSLDIAFLRAQLVARTPAAVSQQMQRLEATLGRPLFLRRGTRLQLTAAGEQLVRHARQLVALNDRAIAEITGEPAAEQVRFGMPQDFAETVLVEALRDFRSTHPAVGVEAVVDRNSVLAGLLQAGRLDLAISIGLTRPDAASLVARVESRWIGARGFQLPVAAPVPLVVLEEPCVFRRFAMDALDHAGIAWRIAFSSPSVSGMWSAVVAGMGIAARMVEAAPPNCVALRTTPALPRLPAVTIALRRAASPAHGEAVDGLEQVVRASLGRLFQAG